MIFFDQECVKQPDAVVVAASTGHSVFLCLPETGNGFAGIQQSGTGACHFTGISPGQGCRARQQLQEIESCPLPGQDGAGIARDCEQQIIGCQWIAVPPVPGDLQLRVKCAKNAVDELGAT